MNNGTVSVPLRSASTSSTSSASLPLPTVLSSSDGSVSMAEVDAQLHSDALQAQALAQRAGTKLNACSYTVGYHSQPIYWCRTCHTDKEVGVCLGCSMNCHLDHDVEELFEKRAFRCDCGNQAAGGSCALNANKEPKNADNAYNHNWRGEYCYCNGTYNPESDVMFSCIMCQDWFHDRCADTKLDDTHKDTDDFFCRACLANPRYDILLPYLDQADQQLPGSSTNTPSMSRSVSLIHGATPTSAAVTPAGPATTVTDATTATPAQQANGTRLNFDEETKESASVNPPIEASVGDADGASLQSPSRKRKAADIDTPANPDSAVSTSESPAAASPAASVSPLNTSAVDASSTSLVCHRLTAASPPVVRPATDRFVAGNWNLFLCTCVACVGEYRSRGFGWLMEDELEADAAKNDTNVLSDMTDADCAAPLDAAFDADAITQSMVGQMPRATALDIIGPFELYQASIKRQLGEFAERHPGVVVSDEVIRTITDIAKQESIEGFRAAKRAKMDQLAAE